MNQIKGAIEKTCIFMDQDNFVIMIDELFNSRFKTTFSLEGIDISDDEESGYESDPEFLETLANHLGVEKITSIHIDDCEYPIGVWITVIKGEDTPVRTNDFAEFAGQIVDIFENFLDENGYHIHNPEIDEDEDADPDTCAQIYGSDYDRITSEVISRIFDENNFMENYPEFSDLEWDDAIRNIYNAFHSIIVDYKAQEPSYELVKELMKKVEDTFIRWGFKKTYHVSYRVDGRLDLTVRAMSIEEAKEKAEEAYADANLGDLTDVPTAYANIIYDANGIILWDRA